MCLQFPIPMVTLKYSFIEAVMASQYCLLLFYSAWVLIFSLRQNITMGLGEA